MNWLVRITKKVCATLNYIEYLLIESCVVTGCVSKSAFASLARNPVETANSAATIKISKITARIKKFKSIINKKKKEHDKVALLPKTKLNSVEVLISKVSSNSNNSRDEFVSISIECDEMKEEANTCNKKHVWSDKINISLRKNLLKLIMEDLKKLGLYKCFWPLIL